jgi:hypothetical protein
MTDSSGDLDCNNVGPNCFIRQECTRDNDCYGLIYACDDETEEETCQWSGSWGLPCTYDSAHNCGPKKKVAPKCGGTPTIFINGLKLADRSLDGYRSRMKEILSSQDKILSRAK